MMPLHLSQLNLKCAYCMSAGVLHLKAGLSCPVMIDDRVVGYSDHTSFSYIGPHLDHALNEFASAILAWIDAGCSVEDPLGLRPNVGVGVNLAIWAMSRSYPSNDQYRLSAHFTRLMARATRLIDPETMELREPSAYPFNPKGTRSFAWECNTGTLYQNPRRLEFLRSLLKTTD